MSTQALGQLEKIHAWLGERNVHAADTVVADILAEIDRLTIFPEMAAIEPLTANEPEMFRSLIIQRQYKAVYYIKGETLYVVDIWDCRQNPSKLRLGLLKKKKNRIE